MNLERRVFSTDFTSTYLCTVNKKVISGREKKKKNNDMHDRRSQSLYPVWRCPLFLCNADSQQSLEDTEACAQ